jgi:biofilm PGA synthesis lipoprotein PgaB
VPTVIMALLTAALAAAAVPEHAVILLYHHVDDETPAATSTPPRLFARHLDLLDREQSVVMPLAEVVAGLRDSATELPDRAVALTFDDGYRSVFTTAFPLLAARGWPFTVFVCPDDVDAGRGPVATWDELRTMALAGATIANHGAVHTFLQRRAPGESPADWRVRVRSGLLAAQERIAREIGAAEPLFAYPYGEWNPDLADLVSELGWTGFGQQSGPAGAGSDFQVLPRFPAAGVYADPGGLTEKLRSLPLPLLAVSPRDPGVPLPAGAARARRPDLRLQLDPAGAPWSGLKAWEAGQGEAVVSWESRSGGVVVVRAREPLAAGRGRTNVTAPSGLPGRWYWYSHLWIVGQEHED